MKHASLPKWVSLAASVAIATAFAAGAAHADTPPALSTPVLKAHQDDLEAMLADLSKVKTPEVAKSYETYLAAQMDKYTQNHKRLHHVAMKGFESNKRLGRQPVDQQKLADDVDKLGETHFARLAVEMERVEKLNPGLGKHFNVLRTLN